MSAAEASIDPRERLGILLAGGSGTRLHPLTLTVNKHLLPVYDKPMIYYPLTTLMLAGIRTFLVISGSESLAQFARCLGDGSQWGVTIEYAEQPRPEGLAQAIHIAEPVAKGRPLAMMLGDNILYGANIPHQLRRAAERGRGATLFAYFVTDPGRFGVVQLDNAGKPVALHEKPETFISNWAVPGLYFYDSDVYELARRLTPSPRGELEITDLNKLYLGRDALNVELFGRGVAWLDGGTHEDLFAASQFVQVMESRVGLKIASPEEVAYHMGYIDLDQLERLAALAQSSSYGAYLRLLATQHRREAAPDGRSQSSHRPGDASEPPGRKR